MKILSLLLVLQVMLLSSAPALALLPEIICCAESCEEEKSNPEQEEQHSEAGEQCNPFACIGCCLLIQTIPQLTAEKVPPVPPVMQLCVLLVENPTIQPQYGIWHPPKLS